MDASTIIVALIGAAGTLGAGIIAALQRSKTVAVEAAEKAVGVVTRSMDAQEDQVRDLRTRVTAQDERITVQDARLTEITGRHGVAVSHIAEREDAADEHLGPERPAWLPPVPDLIRPDVDAARRPR
ncbi:hypothetical protein [Corynebacterium neomassiliense]|uniref:hypothetical protein n=1 Tax=Corynebacterium neomassiliense TaxID=2079482 RepID=UPI00102F33D9|nr:hypothetical protein [Corynebacterium neomassiliense]